MISSAQQFEPGDYAIVSLSLVKLVNDHHVKGPNGVRLYLPIDRHLIAFPRSIPLFSSAQNVQIFVIILAANDVEVMLMNDNPLYFFVVQKIHPLLRKVSVFAHSLEQVVVVFMADDDLLKILRYLNDNVFGLDSSIVIVVELTLLELGLLSETSEEHRSHLIIVLLNFVNVLFVYIVDVNFLCLFVDTV